MPTYLYSCSSGHVTERVCSVRSRRPSKVRCKCGRSAGRDIAAEQGQTVHHPGNWPRKSKALGVMPDQVPEAIEEGRRNGTNLEFAKDGCAIIRNPEHQRKCCKALGYVDRDAYS